MLSLIIPAVCDHQAVDMVFMRIAGLHLIDWVDSLTSRARTAPAASEPKTPLILVPGRINMSALQSYSPRLSR